MFGMIFSVLKELAVEVTKKKAFLLALREEIAYCHALFAKRWKWADRTLEENEKSQGVYVSNQKIRAIDLVVPPFSRAIWENNAFVIALYLDKDTYREITQFYRALQDFSEQYTNLKSMCEKKRYHQDIAFSIWSDLEANARTILAMNEKRLNDILN